MKAKNFRFSCEALCLFLKGLELYYLDTFVVSYRLEERHGNMYLIITYEDELHGVRDVKILLGYDKYDF